LGLLDTHLSFSDDKDIAMDEIKFWLRENHNLINYFLASERNKKYNNIELYKKLNLIY
jgi:hypothetical protein